jgi:hypothetical protein
LCTYITVNPLEPVFSAVASVEILEIVHHGNALRLGRPEEVFLHGVCAVWVLSAFTITTF